MSKTGIIRVILFAILVLSSGVKPMGNRTLIASQASPQTQEDAKKPRPPLQRQKTNPSDADETAPMGRTSISVDVDLVSLQALVADNNGNVFTGLKPENFTIYEDNVKQEIMHFSPVDANITVVMLVEFSKLINNYLDDIYDTMDYFTKSLRKGDWVAVMGYDMHTTIMCDFTQDRQKLYNTLRRFIWPSWSESNLSDAIIETLDRTQELEGKVAILLISTGLDTFSKHTYDQALDKCKNANASVYSVGLGQWYREYYDARGGISQETNLNYLMGDNRLKSFSELTGGAAFFPRFPSELPSIMQNISSSLRSQYSIAYSSSNTAKDGKFRKIRVEVQTDLLNAKGKPLKLKVITRKGYTAKTF
jgi:VWFA-related protein